MLAATAGLAWLFVTGESETVKSSMDILNARKKYCHAMSDVTKKTMTATVSLTKTSNKEEWQ